MNCPFSSEFAIFVVIEIGIEIEIEEKILRFLFGEWKRNEIIVIAGTVKVKSGRRLLKNHLV